MNASTEQQQTDAIFREFRVGNLRFDNRLILTATHLGRYLADPDKYEDNILGYVEERAKGGVGGIILTAMGSANIDALPPDEPSLDWYQGASGILTKIADTAHDYGVPIGMQVQHRGAQGGPVGATRYAPSPIAPLTYGHWGNGAHLPTELSTQQIDILIRRYAVAAKIMADAGLDFVEVQASHGYLLTEFISPRTNIRTDEWGGRAGAVALITSIVGAIKDATAGQLPVSLRVSAEERVEGGYEVPYLSEVLSEIHTSTPLDLLNVSGGVYGASPGIVATNVTPFGYNRGMSAVLRERLDLPVIVAGRVWDPQLMAQILQAGEADLIGLGRALWADPELPNLLRAGEWSRVRPAIGCNQGCIDRADEDVRTCLVNPALGREREFGRLDRGAPGTVAVVGGGPAGLEAARNLADGGHKVTLFESGSELGGTWRLVTRIPGRAEFEKHLNWQISSVYAAGVSVRTGVAFVPADHESGDWDLVVVAAGARYETPVMDHAHVLPPDSALAAPWQTGERIAVLGGAQSQVAVALSLSSIGRDVTLYAENEQVCHDAGPTAGAALQNAALSAGVHIEPGRLPEGPVTVDTVIAVSSRQVPADLVTDCRSKFTNVRVIGDAKEPRDALEAIADGAWVS